MSDVHDNDLWRRLEAALPRELFMRVKIHRQFNPNMPLSEKLHRAVAAALAKST